MRQRCIYFLAFFSAFACQIKAEKDAIPQLLDLVVVDSILVQEQDFFINSQYLVNLVGDSLLAISSIRSPSVSFIRSNGEEVGQIASKDYPMAPFIPSSFDASEYPILYILDKRSESILTFNVEKKQFLNKLKLNLPDNKRPKMAGAKFKKISSGFVVELESSIYDNYNPDYYRNSGDLIYLFDEKGKAKISFLEYPEELKKVEGSLKPTDYLEFTSNDKSILFTFPHGKTIQRFEKGNLGKLLEEIPLPKSNYFDYEPVGADQIISFQELFNSGNGMDVVVPFNHYFNTVVDNKKEIIISTWMNNREVAPNNAFYTNLFIYKKDEESWYETRNPRNTLDLGMLAGVVNDTLYFYEGSLMKQDKKYIKRAILKPIEE
ncbi:hypothetical protein [Algoriphagus chordae]|uniref:6-bladed beta-propeller protein n=1 Tax=Algoriphagus chordae TaxID=237019 RepID=A0A2W7S739_9BACT|nr:hypothetical protein [Algoriphagus chordae]PZX46382.1 hypothetical protein LV85_04338 [Algoriphagus chordae]